VFDQCNLKVFRHALGEGKYNVNVINDMTSPLEAILSAPPSTQYTDWRIRFEFVSALLEHGADPNYSKRNPLCLSASLLAAHGYYPHRSISTLPVDGEIAFLKLLLEYGADPNSYQKRTLLSPIITLIKSGNIEGVALLLAHGADVNQRNRGGKTPLIYATFNPQIQKMLLDHGADCNIQCNGGGTALMSQARFFNHFDINMVISLLDHGADPNKRDNNGETALHSATKHALVSVLINHGADLHLKDNKGETALHKAKTGKIITTLIDHGADVNVENNEGQTPLHCAYNYECLEVLCLRGGSLNKPDYNGQTPIRLLCLDPERYHIDKMMGMLRLEIRSTEEDNDGLTPFQVILRGALEEEFGMASNWSVPDCLKFGKLLELTQYGASVFPNSGGWHHVIARRNISQFLLLTGNTVYRQLRGPPFLCPSYICGTMEDINFAWKLETTLKHCGLTDESLEYNDFAGKLETALKSFGRTHELLLSYDSHAVLRASVQVGRTDCLIAILELLAKRLDPLRGSSSNETLLHEASRHGQEKAARILLGYDCVKELLNHRSDGGWTALDMAFVDGNYPLVALLLEHGADRSTLSHKWLGRIRRDYNELMGSKIAQLSAESFQRHMEKEMRKENRSVRLRFSKLIS
jgi:ankyrin repeat protein